MAGLVAPKGGAGSVVTNRTFGGPSQYKPKPKVEYKPKPKLVIS